MASSGFVQVRTNTGISKCLSFAKQLERQPINQEDLQVITIDATDLPKVTSVAPIDLALAIDNGYNSGRPGGYTRAALRLPYRILIWGLRPNRHTSGRMT